MWLIRCISPRRDVVAAAVVDDAGRVAECAPILSRRARIVAHLGRPLVLSLRADGWAVEISEIADSSA